MFPNRVQLIKIHQSQFAHPGRVHVFYVAQLLFFPIGRFDAVQVSVPLHTDRRVRRDCSRQALLQNRHKNDMIKWFYRSDAFVMIFNSNYFRVYTRMRWIIVVWKVDYHISTENQV